MMKKMAIKIDLIGFILPILIISCWILLPSFKDIPSYRFPSFTHVINVGMDFLFGKAHITSYSGTLIPHVVKSLRRVFLGFILSGTLGISLGLLSGYSGMIHRMISPVIHSLRMVPGIAWLPLTLLLFGTGDKTTLFLISLASFFPIYVNTILAVNEIPKEYMDEAKLICVNNYQILFKVIIPLAFKTIITGLRLGLGICWAYLVLGEMTGVNMGIGAIMMDARMLGNTDILIVCMITIAVLGKLSDRIFVLLSSLIFREEVN